MLAPSGMGQEPRAENLPASHGAAVTLLATLFVHSLLEGIGLGLSMTPGAFTSIFLAIAAHKFFAAFALGSTLRQAWSALPWTLMTSIGVFCAATPVGLAIG